MKSADLITNKSSNETGNPFAVKPILRNRNINFNNNNFNYLSEDVNTMKMNFLKVDMYPDPYRHITTTILEYPESKTIKPTDQDKEARLKNEKAKRMSRRNNLRYMTQPVTLIEIKEIEEDAAALNTNTNVNNNNNSTLNQADTPKACQSNSETITKNEN